MRKLALFCLLLLVVVPAVAQTRSDTFNASGVRVYQANMVRLDDGGCSVTWCGSLTSADGGASIQTCTPPRELTGASNRTTCLNTLDLGANRVLNSMNFAVDAGSQ